MYEPAFHNLACPRRLRSPVNNVLLRFTLILQSYTSFKVIVEGGQGQKRIKKCVVRKWILSQSRLAFSRRLHFSLLILLSCFVAVFRALKMKKK
jgi:hypothetical protein